MDLASVVAALASVGVRVSGSTPNNNIQGDSSRACPTGLAGPEPSGTHNDPGQHFHGSRGYLNVVPLVSQPQLAPQYGPVDSATPGDVTITLPWCCANEALRGMPCASPNCPRRTQISSCGGLMKLKWPQIFGVSLSLELGKAATDLKPCTQCGHWPMLGMSIPCASKYRFRPESGPHQQNIALQDRQSSFMYSVCCTLFHAT